jgi:hypothetical protein
LTDYFGVQRFRGPSKRRRERRPVMRCFKTSIVVLSLCISAEASAQSITYDAGTYLLTIPAVKVGTATYINVALLNVGNYTFTLQGATEQLPAGPAAAAYDPASAMLSLPMVVVGYATYVDVTLRNVGDYTFTLVSATMQDPIPPYPPYQPN